MDQQIDQQNKGVEILNQQITRLEAEKKKSSFDFTESDSHRLLFLNKQINMLGLNAQEKLLTVKLLSSQKQQ